MNYKYQEYYKRFKELRQKIKNKEATWSDMEMLRLEYIDILQEGKDYPVKAYAGNTLRQGCLLYDEFLENGVIKDCEEEKSDNIINTPKTVELKSDGSIISERIVSDNLAIKNKEEILKAHGYSPDKFELVSCKHSIWQQGSKKTGIKNLYSSKITVKPLLMTVKYDDFKLILDNLAKKYNNLNYSHLGPTKVCGKNLNSYGKTLVFSYNDLHWGRYYSEEISGVCYNAKNESKRILNTMSQAIERHKNSKEEIENTILIFGSDFFNSDCYGTTTGGKHKQDNSMNFKDIFSSGLELCLSLINMSKEISQNTTVVVIPGNHGENEDFMLGKCLEAFYNKDNTTRVLADSNPRKYLTIKNTLIGITHGDKEKKNLSNIMAIEKPALWGMCKNKVWLTGHIHSLKENVIENNGTTIYSCPSLALDDEWTKQHGYVSSKRMMGFVFDEIGNLIGTEYYYSDV